MMIEQCMIRPSRLSDLNSITSLAYLAQAGLTTLPKNRKLLHDFLVLSTESFRKKVKSPGNESYLFVMEHLPSKQVIGVCSVLASVGYDTPFYSFHLESVKKRASIIDREKIVDILKLMVTRKGASEIGTLFLHPDYREKGVGRFLSLSRFLFVAKHRERFRSEIMAEMRGVSDEHGFSPFWHHVGRHFFEMDFTEADMLSIQDKSFIAALMPRHPIYVMLLPKEAQDVIGHSHPNTVPALKILESEGFKVSNTVDIFDAGPKVMVNVDDIRTVNESKLVSVMDTSDHSMPLFMMASGRLSSFKVYCGQAAVSKKGLTVSTSLSAGHYLIKRDVLHVPLYSELKKDKVVS